MPGLAGCVCLRTLNPELLRAMGQPLLHRSSYQVRTYADENFLCASIDLEEGGQNDRVESQDGRYRLIFYGVIYEPWGSPEAGLAKKLLARWLDGGWKALADLNGEYLVLVWDRREEELTIVNDRLGLKHLYYWNNHDTFAFASEVKSLTVLSEVSRAIDERALSELLIFGHLQDERTLLRDVKLFPQASVLTWQRGKSSSYRYWRYVHQADSRLENTNRVVQEYAEHVRGAVARRITENRLGLFLSGGLDSRTLAGMLRKIKPQASLSTWTTGHGHDHDSRYAKKIAKAIHAQHTEIKIPETFLQDFSSDYSWVLDGSVTSDGCHRATLRDSMEGKADIFFNGFLGDVLSGGKPFDKVFHISDEDELIEAGYHLYALGFEEPLLAQILRPNVYRQTRGAAREAFARSVREAQVEHPADRVVQAELTQRQQRGNPRVQVDFLNLEGRVTTPFTDRDFIDFTLRLPIQQRLQRRAYIQMICREFPDLSQAPKSGDGLPLNPSRVHASLHWRWVLFQRHVLPRLTSHLWQPHPYAAFVHCEEWFRRANRDFITKTLIDNPVLEEHFQIDALNRLVLRFLDGKEKKEGYLGIASLISFALFRKRLEQIPVFIGRNQTACVAS